MAKIEISPDQNTVIVDGVKYEFCSDWICSGCDLYNMNICTQIPCAGWDRNDSNVGVFKLKQHGSNSPDKR